MTDCEIRNLTDNINNLNVKIKLNEEALEGLDETIKQKNHYFGILLIFAILATVCCFLFAIQRDAFRDGAINRGYMIHNPTNGVLQWVEPNLTNK
jgi:hypothetical protein